MADADVDWNALFAQAPSAAEREIVTRAEAKARGLKRYFTGEKCRNGHISERLVANFACYICHVEGGARRSAEHPGRAAAYSRAANERDMHRRAAGRMAPIQGVPERPTRDQAIAGGLTRYWSDKPCKAGHVGERRVTNRSCVVCELAHGKVWQKANPDKCKAMTAAWRAANPEKRAAQKKRWAQKHRDRINAYHREWNKANRDKRNAYQAKWNACNVERLRDAANKWARANPLKIRMRSHNRRARKKEVGGKYHLKDIKRIFDAQRGKCAYCRRSIRASYEIDHIMPLALKGSNWPRNLQLCCAKCNRDKKAKRPEDFARERGLLI